MPAPIAAYCGNAPIPGSLVWNMDPLLIACLAAAAALHVRSLRMGEPWRQNAALCGWLIVGLALVSPLCNLSVALFSARVGQHMLIALIGAPLIALGLPHLRAGTGGLWAASAAFGMLLWLWHTPLAYEATFTSTLLYWTMHFSMLAAALWLWAALFSPAPGRIWQALGASFFTTMHMSLLGALLTFSPRPLFPVHLMTTTPWGLSPLEDQQIGGLIMWIPAGVLLMTYAIAAFGRELSRLERASATRVQSDAVKLH
jgi:putative membrane protein